MKRIDITIASDGTSTVETSGFNGAECRHASRFLESALGKQTSESLTGEFYSTRVESQAEAQNER